MNCEYHPDREAIWICDDCGKCICKDCVFASGGKIYCPDCFPLHSMGEPADDDTAKVVRASRKDRSRVAAILLILLSALTYLPLLLTWDGESSYFMALLGVAIVSFFFQASLAVERTGWAWWGSAISWVVDILVVIIYYAFTVDPSGILAAIAVIFVGTPAGVFLLLGKVSRQASNSSTVLLDGSCCHNCICLSNVSRERPCSFATSSLFVSHSAVCF